MKSYNHLWEKVISDKNIEEAIRKATKGKRNRPEVAYIFEHIDKQIPLIRQYAQNYMARQKSRVSSKKVLKNVLSWFHLYVNRYSII